MKYIFIISMMLLTLLTGCATNTINRSPTLTLNKHDSIALLPMENHTQTSQAGLRMQAIVQNLLLIKGSARLETWQPDSNTDSLFEPANAKTTARAMAWAKQMGAQFALTGSVTEWRYKTGVDGEPAVGATLQLIDMKTGKIVWNSVGAKAGWGRDSVSDVAQQLLQRMTSNLRLQ